MRELNLSTGTVRRYVAFPVPLALAADDRYTGRGVTLAVLDSAFVPHPDLCQPHNRIVAYYDATGEDLPLDAPVGGSHWHGSMTSVVAAGNGFLSDGVYRSLAPDVQVVLIKVSGPGGIEEESVVRGLEWLLENRDRYAIRLVTTSIQADDRILPAWDDPVNRALRAVVDAGITVVCAAGNDGRVSTPPGNSPWAITVGGVSLAGRSLIAYDPSCYGRTPDGLTKPEVVALADRIAGPILPGTPDADEAMALLQMADAGPESISAMARELWDVAGLPSGVGEWEVEELYEAVAARLRARDVVTPHYKSVDGTSFAAPIVAALVAQMLEANGDLRPEQIKQILCQTADSIDGLERERQGFGLINPRRALERAAGQPHFRPEPHWFAPPHREGNRVLFRHFRPLAGSVSVAGSFNDWVPQPLERDPRGLWTLALALPPGDYAYKYVIDGRWQEDPSNLRLAQDGMGGVNSLLSV